MSRAEKPAFFPWGATTGRPVLAPRLTRCQTPASPSPRLPENNDALSARPIHVRHLTERKVECRCHFAEDIVPLPQDSFCGSISLTGSPQVTHSQLRLAPVSRHSTQQMGLATTIRSLSAKVCGSPFLPDPPASPPGSSRSRSRGSDWPAGRTHVRGHQRRSPARCAAFRRRRACVDRFTPQAGGAPPSPR
jgi:hypothetical protein